MAIAGCLEPRSFLGWVEVGEIPGKRDASVCRLCEWARWVGPALTMATFAWGTLASCSGKRCGVQERRVAPEWDRAVCGLPKRLEWVIHEVSQQL